MALTISKKYEKMSDFYKHLSRDYDVDVSRESLVEAYKHETHGDKCSSSGIFEEDKNGYLVGKRLFDITASMWIENADRFGWLPTIKGLIEDENIPNFVIRKVFKGYVKDKDSFYKEKNISINVKEEFDKLFKQENV